MKEGPAQDNALRKEEVAVWRGITRIARLAVADLDRRLNDELGMGLAEFDALAAMEGARERLRMTDLASSASVSLASATRLAERLAAAGLAERHANEGDARSVHVVITEAGRERLAAARRLQRAVIRETCVPHLARGDVRKLAKLLERARPGITGRWKPKLGRANGARVHSP